MKMVKDLLLIIFTISLINCLNLRELKLERDKEKYDALVKVAKQTVYQLYNKTIDFNDRNDAYIQKKDVMTIKVVIDDINYEICCTQEYVDSLKENINGLFFSNLNLIICSFVNSILLLLSEYSPFEYNKGNNSK